MANTHCFVSLFLFFLCFFLLLFICLLPFSLCTLYVFLFSFSFVLAQSLVDTCRRLSAEIWLKLAVLRQVLFAFVLEKTN